MKKSIIMYTPDGHIDLANPSVDQISVVDIAVSLAGRSRFCGFFGNYTVGDHCIDGARFILNIGGDVLDALVYLLHDAVEAYVSDVPSPVKELIGKDFWWEKAEAPIHSVIMQKLVPEKFLRHIGEKPSEHKLKFPLGVTIGDIDNYAAECELKFFAGKDVRMYFGKELPDYVPLYRGLNGAAKEYLSLYFDLVGGKEAPNYIKERAAARSL